MRAIEIRRTSLSSEVVLIIEHLLAEDWSAVKAESRRAKSVGGSINRFGEGISRQDLKAMIPPLNPRLLYRCFIESRMSFAITTALFRRLEIVPTDICCESLTRRAS